MCCTFQCTDNSTIAYHSTLTVVLSQLKASSMSYNALSTQNFLISRNKLFFSIPPPRLNLLWFSSPNPELILRRNKLHLNIFDSVLEEMHRPSAFLRESSFFIKFSNFTSGPILHLYSRTYSRSESKNIPCFHSLNTNVIWSCLPQ